MGRLGGAVAFLHLSLAAAPWSQSDSRVPPDDAVRLAEAVRLARLVSEEVWPGWGRTAMPLLLVRDSAEFLIGHPHPSAEFAPLGTDSLVQSEIWARARRFAPTLLATFPAVGGLPTIVIGSAERTRQSSTAWILTLLHEHFHQWQYSLPDYYTGVERLDLARGDSSGRWMLDYPFPYGSAPVQRSVRRWASALALALTTPPGARARAIDAVLAEAESVRRILSAADYRYLEFQLWQEGVARFIEYAVAAAAARHGTASNRFCALPDHESYAVAARRIRRALERELEQMSLGRDRRVSFYPLGAATAVLLEESRLPWKRAYAERPFALTPLLRRR